MPELDHKVRQLVAELERDILRTMAWTVPALAPVLVWLAVLEWQRESSSLWLIAMVAVTLLMSVGLSSRWPHRVRGVSLCAGLTLASGCSLLHFGPLLATGVFFAGTSLVSTFFYGVRGAALSVGALLGSIGIAALGLGVPARQPALLDLATWARVALGAAIGLILVSRLIYRLQNIARRALDTEVRDLRRQERDMAERERVLKAAESTDRLTSLGRMAGGVAHDFNNALQVIQMGVAVLRKGQPDTHSEALLVEIETASRNAAGTVRELLTFSRQAPQPQGRCAPGVLLERLAPTLRRVIPKHIGVELQGSFEGEVGLAEQVLEQVLLSLVFNARDALTDGGCIEISYRTGEDGGLALSVSDDGTALDEATRQRIFEPFSTRSGSGFGLATAWGIVTRAGGTIEVQSAPNTRTVFTVQLPAAPSEPLSTPPPPPTSLSV